MTCSFNVAKSTLVVAASHQLDPEDLPPLQMTWTSSSGAGQCDFQKSSHTHTTEALSTTHSPCIQRML